MATALPLTIFAEEIHKETPLTYLGESDLQQDQTAMHLFDPYEETSLREGNVKHFRLEDGSYVAVQYSTQIHKQDENENWVDIDNRLSLLGSEYANADAKIKLSKHIPGNGAIFTLHDGNHKIELSLGGAIKKTVGVATNTKTEFDETATTLQKMMTLDHLSSRVVYADILEDVDLEYVINGLHIKENIYIKARKDNYSFTFTLKLNNLLAEQNEDGSIRIYDPDTDEDVYVIPLGYMFDADGVESSAVSYTLTDQGNGSYHLTVTPDANWINAEDRAFPVCVDPPLLSVEASSYEGTHISTASPNANYASAINLTVGYQTIGFVKATLPTLPNGAYIYDATYTAESKLLYGNRSVISVRKVTSDWDSSTLTYTLHQSGAGTYQTKTSDFKLMPLEWDVREWNITGYVKDWYNNPASNYGLAFVANEFGSATPSYAGIRNNHSTAALTIRYYRLSGIESYWSYSQASAGLAGTGYVNLATGGLSFAIDTLACTDSLFGYMPTLVYNQSMAGKYYTASNSDAAFVHPKAGYGFYLTTNESIVIGPDIDGDAADVDSYIWIDGDGTSHEFLPVEEDGSVTHYVDTDGMQLTLTPTDTGFTIEDQSHLKRHFVDKNSTALEEGSGSLQYIEDSVGNKLQFVVDTYGTVYSVRLVPVGMGSITLLNFTYTSGYLTTITNPNSGDTIRFSYSATPSGAIGASGGYLREVKRTFGATTLTSTYTYDASGKLITAYDATNAYGIAFTYTGNQVTEMSEFAGSDSTAGQTLGFTYRVGGAEVRSSGSDDTYGNGDDIITHYVFDDEGRAASLYSTDVTGTTFYGGTSGTYATQENVKNNLSSTFSFGTTGENFLYNGGFEKTQTTVNKPFVGWDVSSIGWASAQGEDIGGTAAKVLTSISTSRTIKQTVQLPSGQYTFSVDVVALNSPDTQVTLYARSVVNSALHFTKTISTNDIAVANTTYSAALTFTVNNAGAYEVGIEVVSGGTGTISSFVAFDNAVLAKSSGVGEYNFVEHGSFDHHATNLSWDPLDSWQTGGTIVSAESIGADAMYGDVLRLDGTNTQASQVIYENTATPTEEQLKNSPSYTLSVSGMAKGTEQILGFASHFELQLKITYCIPKEQTGEVTEYYESTRTTRAKFVKDNNEWQYGFAALSTLPYFITKMEVVCVYYGHAGYGYFDRVAVLVEDDRAYVENIYDADGNLHTKRMGNNASYAAYYENGDLFYQADTEGNITLYTYDENHLVTEAILCTYVCSDGIKGCYHPSGENPLADLTLTAKTKTTYTYNAYGMLLSTTVVTGDISNVTHVFTPDGEGQITSSTTYAVAAGSKIFGAMLTATDSRGGVTRYFYDESRGLLLAVIEPDGTGTVYQYDEVGNMTGVLPATYTASSNTYSSITNAENVAYTYDSHLWLSEIETESTTYSFSYNVFGQTEGISVGNTEIISHTYEEQGGKLISTTYANGTTVSYVYNDRGQLGEVKYTNDGVTTTAYTYLYNEDGSLNRFEDARNGETYLYEYDAAGRLRSYVRYGGDAVINFAGAVTYLANGAVGSTKYSGTYLVGTTTAEMNLSYGYTYNEDGSLSMLQIESNSASGESAFTYDSFGRLTLVETTFEDGVRYPIDFSAEKAYTYLTEGGNTTALVSVYTTTVGGVARTYTFTYDVNGNITKIVDSAGYTCRYVYDDLGQLIREDDGYTNHTYLYTYDNAGNIIKKETYNYTGAGIIPVFGGSSITYTYGSANGWGDQLTSFGGNAITYDANGNPVQYYNGFDFTWVNGTELAAAVNGTYNLSFSYDDNGVRVRKVVNGVEHIYTVNGTQILTEKWVDVGVEHLLVYLYDASGSPIGMEYRNSVYPEGGFDLYLFETNLQGDVIGVYNELGEKLISYTYDAWGNCTMTASANVTAGSDFAAAFNPFRYRGYYYDTELGLYYLNARYYDPNTGRFISPDPKYISTGQGLIGNNMYAYCLNNPIMFLDIAGTDAILFTVYHIIYGLPVVGHSALFIQDENGTWYMVEFNKETFFSSPKVMFEEIGTFEEVIERMSLYGEGAEGYSEYCGLDYEYQYLLGDFSKSVLLAKEYAEKQTYPKYKPFKNNCLHYVKHILQAGNIYQPLLEYYIMHSTRVFPDDFHRDVFEIIARSGCIDRPNTNCTAIKNVSVR